jgi:HSP20 family protein
MLASPRTRDHISTGGGVGAALWKLDKEDTMNALTRRGGLFDEFFRDFAPGYFIQPLHGDPLPAQIKIDVQEREGAFDVQAEIPGVRKEDIRVDIDGSMLSLQAEVRQEDRQEGGEGRPLRNERYYGAISRTVQLPAEVDEAQAKAKYENGVLRLTLPKKQETKAQRRVMIE